CICLNSNLYPSPLIDTLTSPSILIVLVTKSVISGYECNRVNQTKDVLDLLSYKFDMYYFCMEGYRNLYIILISLNVY
ncbi:MAG: hypothetical protein IJH55_07370, partial [Romboutsia sp.]|nr:hypothetical protein [Romboutsia sp.]